MWQSKVFYHGFFFQIVKIEMGNEGETKTAAGPAKFKFYDSDTGELLGRTGGSWGKWKFLLKRVYVEKGERFRNRSQAGIKMHFDTESN